MAIIYSPRNWALGEILKCSDRLAAAYNSFAGGSLFLVVRALQMHSPRNILLLR